MMSPQTPRTESPELGFDDDERALAEALRGVPVPEPSAELDARILAMAETEEGKAALNSVYQIVGLKVVDDTFFDEFRALLEASGEDIKVPVESTRPAATAIAPAVCVKPLRRSSL